jgi:hypothetical protein
MVSFESGVLFKAPSSVTHSVLQHLFQCTLKLNFVSGPELIANDGSNLEYRPFRYLQKKWERIIEEVLGANGLRMLERFFLPLPAYFCN